MHSTELCMIVDDLTLVVPSSPCGVVFFASPSSLHGPIGHQDCGLADVLLIELGHGVCVQLLVLPSAPCLLLVSTTNIRTFNLRSPPVMEGIRICASVQLPHYSTMSLASDRRIDALSTNVQSARHITSPAAAAHKCAQHPAGTSNARPARAGWQLD
jgi:hypothetical protein